MAYKDNAGRPLPPRQQRFAEEYPVDLHGTKAAIRAGYAERSAHVTASQLLKNPKVLAAISKAMAERAKRCEVSADQVVNELRRVAFGDIRDVVAVEGGSVRVMDTDQLTDDQAAAISEISETTSATGGSLKVRMHSKLTALDLLGKHLGLFVNRHEVQHSGDPVNAVRITLVKPDGTEETETQGG